MRLVGLRRSPWTAEARFALDRHGLAHDLALRLRQARGPATVPVLFTPEGALRGWNGAAERGS